MRKVNPDDMYNAAVKSMWIEDFMLSHKGDSLRGVIISLMSRFAPYEKERGADLCTWTDTEYTKGVLSNVLPPASMTRRKNFAIVQNYIIWCMDHAIPGAVNALNGITYDDGTDASVYKKLVANPRHLAVYLDQVLGAELRMNEDCIRRCFMWLAYIGIPTGKATLVSRKDIDLDHMEIVYNKNTYRIYPEAARALRIVTESDTIERTRGPYICVEPRSSGDMLLRGMGNPDTPELRYESISRTLSMRENEAIRTGRTDRRMSYTDAYRSGVFYRMYEDEIAGFPVDFAAIPDIFGSRSKRTATMQYIVNRNRQDYENWKKAYR